MWLCRCPPLLEIRRSVIRTSGLRLKALAGFPTQRKSKMISFIAKSKRSCSEREKAKQKVLQYKLNGKRPLSSHAPNRWLLRRRGVLLSVTGHHTRQTLGGAASVLMRDALIIQCMRSAPKARHEEPEKQEMENHNASSVWAYT